jgi:hypothetical protein
MPRYETEPATLLKADRPRQIDAVIDYFGDPHELSADEPRRESPTTGE